MQIETCFTEETFKYYKALLNEENTDESYGKIIEEIAILIWKDLGPYYGEAVYQKALHRALSLAGFWVKEEVTMQYVYLDVIVTNRRCDLMVHHQNFQAILELKKSDLKTLVDDKLYIKRAQVDFFCKIETQIRFYMDSFNCKTGFIILFPVRRGFPVKGQETDISGLVEPFISKPIYSKALETIDENITTSLQNAVDE